MRNTIKTLLSLLTILLTFQTFSIAQSIELTDSEVERFLCKKWVIQYMDMQGMKIAPQEGAEFIFLFQKDGSFEMLPNNELDPNPEMKWVYSKENKSIRLYESERLIGRILELKKDKFVMDFESTEDMPMEGMKGHFKPAV
jgi:hypothetical protein